MPWLTETARSWAQFSRCLINSLINLLASRRPVALGVDRATPSAASASFKAPRLGRGWPLLRLHHARARLLDNGQMWVDTPELAKNLPSGNGLCAAHRSRRLADRRRRRTARRIRVLTACAKSCAPPARRRHFHPCQRPFRRLSLAATGQRPGEPPTLWAMAARRWMKLTHPEGVGVRLVAATAGRLCAG